MTPEQKKNLLIHAAFMDNVVTSEIAGINMAVYYSYDVEMENTWDMQNVDTEDLDRDALNKPADEDCGFCACAIGWAARNPDLPKPKDYEEWEQYAERIFGCSNWDAGAYAFHASLNINQGKELAERIRNMVKAYPNVLMISEDDWNDENLNSTYEMYKDDFNNGGLYNKFKGEQNAT